MAFQWKKFQFFERELLCDGSEAAAGASQQQAAAARLFQDFTPSCSTSGRGHLIFGDTRGTIKIVNRDFEETKFSAYEAEVMQMQQLKKTNVLVTIGNDGTTQNTTIKIWRLDQNDADGNPMLARAIKIFSPKFPAVPVTSFTVLEDLSQLALGLGNGAVMLFDGNLLRDRNVKQSLIQGQGKTVVSVHFREPDTTSADGTPIKNPQPISLFVVTTNTISTIFTKHAKFPRLEIDSENGCEELAGTCMNDEKRLVVSTKDAVFFYESEEKREAYGFEGNKKMAHWFNGYLVLVCESGKNDGSGLEKKGGGVLTPDTLTIYDLKNKFIAYTCKLESISLLVSEYSSLFIVTSSANPMMASSPSSSSPDGSSSNNNIKFYQLTEHDLQSKMETLFKKNFYSIAIALATSSSTGKDRTYVMDIFQRYGDHLYSKGDYDGAIQQYLETIDHANSEPSYVIRKFLDAQRIHNLTRYLQVLHEKGRANKDHTTLLLSCWTKLKDVQKLDEFVKQSNASSSSSSSAMSFDVLTAINVCRQANYYDHALYLARKHNEHDLYLQIQIEDVGNMGEALKYIATLMNPQEIEKYIKLYGSKLVTTHPKETTEILMKLCTGWSNDSSASSILSVSSASASPSSAAHRSNPAEFIHLFVEHPAELEVFLQHFFEPVHANVLQTLSASTSSTSSSKKEVNPQTIICNTLLEIYLRQYAAHQKSAKKDSSKSSATAASSPAADSASSSSTSSSADENPYFHKTSNFLKNAYGKYDTEQALVMCKMYSFEKGITHLYEKLKLYHEIVQYHMEHHQIAGVLQACQRHGDKVPNLWVQALSYFAAQPEPYEEEIQQVLRAISDRKLLPPLMILQILSQNPHKQLSVVKDFIVHSLTEESDFIRADQEEIARFQMETQTMREEIERLHTQPITFQGLKCHQCTSGLSLPAVHFLCMHSFHQRCILDSELECPKCAQQYRQVRGIRESMRSTSTQHDLFFKKLDASNDGFSVVAEYYGRGIFEKQKEEAKAGGGASAK